MEAKSRERRNRIFNRGRKECLLSVCNSASVFACRLNNTNLPPHPSPSQSMYPVTMFSPVSVTCNRSSSFSSFLHHNSALLPLLPLLSKLLSFESGPFAPSFSNIIFQEKGSKPRLVDFPAAGTKWLDHNARPSFFDVEIARFSGHSKGVDHEIHRSLEIPGCLHIDYRSLW